MQEEIRESSTRIQKNIKHELVPSVESKEDTLTALKESLLKQSQSITSISDNRIRPKKSKR